MRHHLGALSQTLDEQWNDALRTGEAAAQDAVCQMELHRLAFAGDDSLLRNLLPTLSRGQLLALDGQGNTALHVAVLRHQHAIIRLLLEAGIPPNLKNARGWTPLDEAVSLCDAEAATLLHAQAMADARLLKKRKKEELSAVMAALPDFEMQLHWELGSQLLGALLRLFAPTDTYTVTKVGKRLRCDGTLLGLEDTRGLIPRWKCGRFTLLVDVGASPADAFLVDHTTRCYYDLYRERKAHKRSVREEIGDMLAKGAAKLRVDDAKCDIRAVATWLGRPATERVHGWEAEVYWVEGTMLALVRIPLEASFEGYLSMMPPPDTLVAEDSTNEPQRFRTRCWLARRFPINVQTLIPLLECIGGSANKSLAEAAAFLRSFPGLEERFPVRIQVPLPWWTIYLQLSFEAFKAFALGSGDREPGFFEVPAGYRLDSFGDIDLLHKGLERMGSYSG